MRFLCLFTIAFVAIAEINCIPNFFRGKRFDYLKRVDSSSLHLLSAIPEQYYDQRLDHFNEALTTTWKQRYWVNDEFFDRVAGPVFLMIGGEGEENPIWMKNGQWVNYAKKFVSYQNI
jgi:hypothetical protein